MSGDNVIQITGRARQRTPIIPVELRLAGGAVLVAVRGAEVSADFTFTPDQAEEFACELLRKARAARAESGHLTTTGPR